MAQVLKIVTLQPDEKGEMRLPEGWEAVSAEKMPQSNVWMVALVSKNGFGSGIQTK